MADFSWVPKELEGRFSYVNGRLVASCEMCGATRQTAGRGAVLRDISAGKTDRFKRCGLHGVYCGMKPTREDIDSWPSGHKRCNGCKEVKPFAEFNKHSAAMFGYDTTCKVCRRPRSKSQYASRTWEQKMYERAKVRARRNGREFSIDVSDISIPEYCPVLGIPLILKANSQYCPSLDRIDSDGGYTPDNIMVISRRANTLKNNMTVEECEAILMFMRS